MSIKISIIGAGSSVFSLSLIRDICCTKRLNGCRVSLMDIDEKRLEDIYGLCVRYANEMGSNIEIHKTMDREESMQGADFVINTALHVPYELWKRGWEIAQKHGYRYGGSLHILHDEAFWINFYQYQLMESVYEDVLRICPNAWYLLVANPVMAGVTYLKRKYPDGKIVGLCHGYGGIRGVAEVLGLDMDKVEYEMSGLNHFLWMTHFTYEGKDAFPILDKWIEEHSEEHFKNCGYCNGMGPKAIDLYRRFGVFPIGDTGNPGGGAWGWWYHSDEETQKYWNDDPEWWFREVYFKGNASMLKRISDVVADPDAKVTELFPPLKKIQEPMVPLIESIAFDVPRVIITNILNDGEFVAGVPRDFEVEIPTLVSGRGIQGIRCTPLPKTIEAFMLRDRVAPVELELSAYIQKDYDALLLMILSDPWTRNERQARAMLDEILDQPELKEMKAHYQKRKIHS